MFFIKDITAFSTSHLREVNEDLWFHMSGDGMPDRNGKILIMGVMDGVSNSNGYQAVRIAIKAMRPVLAELIGKVDALLELDRFTVQEEIFHCLRKAIQAADITLRQYQYLNTDFGTTVCLVVVFGERVYTANIGDSPIYQMHIPEPEEAPALISLFECHNKAGEAVREGWMTKEEALTSNLHNKLTLAVGGTGLRSTDIYTTSAYLGESDLLLLGSDGALSVLTEEEMAALFADHLSQGLNESIKELYARIQNSSSTDNATVVACLIETN